MTLAEKIAALRGERRLSQGDLAEKLDVSRQSVSKWETGQAVPELDKIVKLADLFGVSVDELVRDEEDLRPEPSEQEAPQEEPPQAEASSPAEPEPKIVYVERRRLKGTQILGAVLLVLGLLGVILGVAVSGTSGTYVAIAGIIMVVLGLPLLLSRKHPFLITGWVAAAFSCLVLNPYTSIAPWGLRGGLYMLYLCLTRPELNDYTNQFGAAVGILRGTLVLVLLFFTVRAALRWWDGRRKKAA